jgi:lincosamide nucleotidyltransferase A/C/D/E
MDAADVLQLLDWLTDADVEVWLDGGWGVDALVGEQKRPHKDLHLVVLDEHTGRMREVLSGRGSHTCADRTGTSCCAMAGGGKSTFTQCVSTQRELVT